MSVTLATLMFRVLVFVVAVAVVESLSSHFIGGGRYSLQLKSRRLSYSESSISFRRSTERRFLATESNTRYRRRLSLFSSREPYEEADEDRYDYPRQNFRETSEEEIRLKRMAKNSQNKFPKNINDDIEGDNYGDEDRDYYLDEEDRDQRNNRGRPEKGRAGRLAAFDDAVEDSFDYDDEDFEGEELTAGNFWSNPKGSMDRPPAESARRGRQRQQQRRRYDEDDDDIRESPRQPERRRRSPVPSQFGQVPKIFSSFYDQFFWYGFDIDDSAKVGDNTIFGGTKGKFNGFNYLREKEKEGKNNRSRPSNNSVRRLPPSSNDSGDAITRKFNGRLRRDEKIDYDYNDDDEYDDGRTGNRDYYRVDDSTSKRKPLSSSSYTPPTDRTSTRYDSIDEYDDYENDDDDYEDADSGRIDRKNSARYNDEDESIDRRSGGRRRRRQQNNDAAEWSPLSMIESFLGIDREEMDYKAEVYNAKMGLGKRRRSSSVSTSSEEELDRGRDKRRRLPQRVRSARDDPERRGYAYRYDATLDDESTPILDIDPADDVDPESMMSDSRRRQQSLDGDVDDEKKFRKKEPSWEERQIAMDRVPPVDVLAWGPSGELPMSAREKAFLDAQEDIETARRKLKLAKKKESESEAEITILKVDADRQRLKLSEYPPEERSRRDVEELRQIELDIDDASRDLRRSRTKVDRALEILEELEERHYAIMSCYNIDQASLLVGESLNQFSASIQGPSANTRASSSNTDNTNINDGTANRKVDDAQPDATEG